MAQGIFTKRQQLRGLVEKSWGVPSAPPQVEYLVVAGGGSSAGQLGGGGGAGGLLQGITPVNAGSAITVTIGAGGVTPNANQIGNNGGNSVFGSITAIGGGGGGSWAAGSGAAGGSGGGGNIMAANGQNPIGGQGTYGQGNAGGTSPGTYGSYITPGGGGGAGTAGNGYLSSYGGGNNGGGGIASAILGTVYTWAGGGGGIAYGSSTQTGGNGGVGGGGGGGAAGSATLNYGQGGVGYNSGSTPSANYNGGNGGTNSGGGGGGASLTSGGSGGNGGSGIVIISYPDTYSAPASFGGANSPTASTSGSGSFYLNGSSYLQYAGQSAFAFGTGDFTVEFWIYQPSLLGSLCVDFRPATGVNGAYGALELNTNGQLNYYANSAYRISSATGVLIAGTWQHIALTRSSTSTKLFVNGTQVGSTYSDSTNYSVGSTSPFIGAGSAANAFVTGYISNLRIVKGTAVYTSNFTTPTAPLTAITNTSLLLGTVSPNQYLDSSTNAYNPTITGSPTWNQLSPFATGLGYKNRVYTWTGSGTVTF